MIFNKSEYKMTKKQAIAHTRQYSKYWLLSHALSEIFTVMYKFPEAEERLRMAADLLHSVVADINQMTPKSTFVIPKKNKEAKNELS